MMNTELEYNLGGTSQVLIEVEQRFRDRVKGLMIDTSYDPARHALPMGKVVQLPIALGGAMVEQLPVGVPMYGPVRPTADEDYFPHPAIYAIGNVLKYHCVWDIAPEVEIGDYVWIKPRAMADQNSIVQTIKMKDGRTKWIMKVSYDSIYCSVRRYDITDFDGAILAGTKHLTEEALSKMFVKKFGKEMPSLEKVEVVKENETIWMKVFTMIGGWCLIEPSFEDWESLLIPVANPNILDKDGKPTLLPKDRWIQKKVMPDMDKFKGTLAFYGTPLKGDTCELRKGMKVIFKPLPDSYNKKGGGLIQEIEGTKYIVCRQSNIFAEIE